MKAILFAVALAVASTEGYPVAGKTEMLAALDQMRGVSDLSIQYVKNHTKFWENGVEISAYLDDALSKAKTLFDTAEQSVKINGVTVDAAKKGFTGTFDLFIQTNYKLGRLFFPTMQTNPKAVEPLVEKAKENLITISTIYGPLFATVFPNAEACQTWTVFTTSRIIALRSLEFIKAYADDWPIPSMMHVVINGDTPQFTYNFDKMVEHYEISDKYKAQTDYIRIKILYENLIDYSFPAANNWYYDKKLSPAGKFDLDLFKANFYQILKQLGYFLFQ